jgi:hypothetical protein
VATRRNAAGVFSQLVAVHVGERGQAAATLDSRIGDIDAHLELATGQMTDLDRQIAQIDATVGAATQRGKASTGLSALGGQKKARSGLAGEREKAAATVELSRRNAPRPQLKGARRRPRQRPSSMWRNSLV